jgi:transcription initiation factor IIE alpha subunit
MNEDDLRARLESVAPAENMRVSLIGADHLAAQIYETMSSGREYTTNDIAVLTGNKLNTVQNVLGELLSAGLVTKDKIMDGRWISIWRLAEKAPKP